MVLVQVENLSKIFKIRKKELVAVQQVTFDLDQGKTLALVGESGCGKSTLGRLLMRLYEPSSGRILYRGYDITTLRGKALMELRRKMQMVFQDPSASFNPRMTLAEILKEPLEIHKGYLRSGWKDKVEDLVEQVGLNPKELFRYPHELSGGQRQRLGIARALCLQPEFLVLDEPVSALDVSVQAQVINLLKELQERLGLTYLFIAHQLSVVRHLAHRTLVMYLGHMAELASTDELFAAPLHPYTQALFSSIPVPDPEKQESRIVLKGEPPSALFPPTGCPFHTRCPYAMPICETVYPKWQEVKEGHFVSCHLTAGVKYNN